MRAFLLAGYLFIWPVVQAATADHQASQVQPSSSASSFDSSTPLEARITVPPESVLQRYRNRPDPAPSFHELTQAERQEVNTALQQLPAFSHKALLQHVRTISFIEGISANGTTSLEEGSSPQVFDIVLRAGLLRENVSQFLTRKENSYYVSSGSDITLNIEGGSLPAVLYVLTHESVHVLDISTRAGQEGPPRLFKNSPSDLLVKGIWEDARTKVPMYRGPLFQPSWFGSGKLQSLGTAEPTYRALAQTPFVSLYGSSNWYENVAELVTCYYMTQVLKQPYQIVLRKGTETQFSLSPSANPLVQARFQTILPLFE